MKTSPMSTISGYGRPCAAGRATGRRRPRLVVSSMERNGAMDGGWMVDDLETTVTVSNCKLTVTELYTTRKTNRN